MKNETLQQLLAKYQQGTLTGEELERLNNLAHKEEVMSAAESRAKTLIFRRTLRNTAFVVAGLAVIGVGVWAINPTSQDTLVAERQETPKANVEQIADIQHVEEPVADIPLVASKVTKKTPAVQHAVMQEPVPGPEIVIPQEEEPTVVCNNQCDADSVINDIWRFLTA